jgi:hypothetical protein
MSSGREKGEGREEEEEAEDSQPGIGSPDGQDIYDDSASSWEGSLLGRP